MIVVGAGVGGRGAASAPAAGGIQVDRDESAPSRRGTLGKVAIGAARLDAGPSVFTRRGVFRAVFAVAGVASTDGLTRKPVDILAHLDVFADHARAADAIRPV